MRQVGLRLAQRNFGTRGAANQQAPIPAEYRLADEDHRDTREAQQGAQGDQVARRPPAEADERQPHQRPHQCRHQQGEEHLLPAEEGAEHRQHLPITLTQALHSPGMAVGAGDRRHGQIAAGSGQRRVQRIGRARQQAGRKADGDARQGDRVGEQKHSRSIKLSTSSAVARNMSASERSVGPYRRATPR